MGTSVRNDFKQILIQLAVSNLIGECAPEFYGEWESEDASTNGYIAAIVSRSLTTGINYELYDSLSGAGRWESDGIVNKASKMNLT